jgi:hypothetical protein
MKTSVPLICFLAIGGALLFSAPQDQQAPAQKKGGKKGDKSGPKKVELPHPFYWAAPDDFRGDWQGNGYVAQVFPTMDKIFSVQDSIPQQADNGLYQANIFRKFDVANDTPVAVLHGELSGGAITFTGDGWTGTIAEGHFKAASAGGSFDLQHITRTPPSLGMKPPPGATVLFDGANMNAWAKMKEKDWLTEDGPSPWHLVPGGAMEVVPRAGGLISHKYLATRKFTSNSAISAGPPTAASIFRTATRPTSTKCTAGWTAIRAPGSTTPRRPTPSLVSAAPGRRSTGRPWISILRPPASTPPATRLRMPASPCCSTAPSCITIARSDP